MKNKIIQYLPEFVNGLTGSVVPFDSFQDIKNTAWIKNFSDHPKFKKFEFSKEEKSLMAIFENDKKFIVGKLENENGLEDLSI